jgi:hypothetical protein
MSRFLVTFAAVSNLTPISSLFLERNHEPSSNPFLSTGIDVSGSSTELRNHETTCINNRNRHSTYIRNGGSSLGSDNRGQSFGRQSQGTERSGAVSSEKSQIQTGKTNETTVHRGSKTHVGLRSRSRHYAALHRRSHHVFAFQMPRHRFVIHRHGRRFVALNESGGV